MPKRKELTKKAFVAGLPETMSALDVVAKAADLNITMTPRQVVNIRSKLRRAVKRGEAIAPKGPRLRRRPSHAAVVIPNAPLDSVEQNGSSNKEDIRALKSIVLRIGITETRRVLDHFEASILGTT